jgi:hypothetical protein
VQQTEGKAGPLGRIDIGPDDTNPLLFFSAEKTTIARIYSAPWIIGHGGEYVDFMAVLSQPSRQI